jgi:hypothetical protein
MSPQKGPPPPQYPGDEEDPDDVEDTDEAEDADDEDQEEYEDIGLDEKKTPLPAPPRAPEEPKTPSSLPASKNKRLLYIIGGVIVALMVIALAFFAGNYYGSQPEVVEDISTTPIASSVSTAPILSSTAVLLSQSTTVPRSSTARPTTLITVTTQTSFGITVDSHSTAVSLQLQMSPTGTRKAIT